MKLFSPRVTALLFPPVVEVVARDVPFVVRVVLAFVWRVVVHRPRRCPPRYSWETGPSDVSRGPLTIDPR